ncbi:glutamate--tRNA ligase [Sphingopyxis alaskensis]|uniref:Glutamate--tRNA ligase 1 n=1 Tax=Sphingopyxis alaskensis (strain DSM 13593 / LMG 18877 / RB2256) TaxID=317655 RepID=SYE1_SPHAL|nr:glutamate--tRNA ligase [Sphingopyxis alaskensis]Q1GUX4.1 RecName: Full=Glutamate--tRNA ligase 1; AltName: Full=Glutamyl-tRNA synthetase 1; Short=GluRS 1 [Sphingopyxis alaskensis RB2256]ABF52548.1 glutamyl-tRNA synthetase [Sphingopyxis alaskensis RB2256]MCM3418083.1 glutamate--tRNA ligase [Sphingopyxis alaskensis]
MATENPTRVATATPEATGADVVTRFAPSPTGYLHIGGARTALFNWLFARHHGGKFLLRIEDTDRARSTDAAIDAILDGMRWLELDWDGETVFQFARAPRHAEVAHDLLARGGAYRCYLTQDELAAMRAEAQEKRQPFRVRSPWRDRDDGDPAAPHVLRLRAPQDGAVTIADKVQGEVTVQNAELDDFILLRSDGTPTYMLSVVVDDNDMGVTHVIRGDDHLNNAFRQLALIRAMDWREPVYAHVPLIHGADGTKLSKRHGALGVDAYRDAMGYLPEAVNNYLLRLGWGHGDDEIISRAQAIEWFDLDHVGRSPSRFDFKKLENLNGHYLREADDARLAGLVAPRIEALVGRALDNADRDLLTQAMAALKPRAKTLGEIAEGATFLFAPDPMPVDEKAAEVLASAPEGLLAAMTQRLRGLDDDHWTSEDLEAAVRAEAEAAELGLGKLAQPLRAALTGRTVSPGIFDVLLLLGRKVSLARLDAAQHYPAGA